MAPTAASEGDDGASRRATAANVLASAALASVVAVVGCSRADPAIHAAPEATSAVVAIDEDTFAPNVSRMHLEDFEREGWRISGRVDVNGDGVDDAFFENPGYCGSGGCTTPLVASRAGGYTAVFEAFAKGCWAARDVVDGHSSIDCIERFDTCGPNLFVVRARWDPARRKWIDRTPPGLPSPPRCAHGTLAVDARGREWPMGDVVVLHLRDDGVADVVEGARAFSDVMTGPFDPLLLDGDGGSKPHLDHAAFTEVVDCASADEVSAGTSLVVTARSVDGSGAAWVSTEKGWLRERDVVCVP